MDEKQKKILLIGGALLVGAFLLSQRTDVLSGGGGGSVADWVTGYTVTQATKKEDAVGGYGDVYTYYNIDFPESGDIILPPPNFIPTHGGGGGTTKKEKNAFALPPSVYIPPEKMTPSFVATVEEAATKKEQGLIPPQFQWR